MQFGKLAAFGKEVLKIYKSCQKAIKREQHKAFTITIVLHNQS